jgi:N6-adenosine-specific RNA methylase IME4
MTFATIVADPPWPYDNFHGPRATAAHRPNSWDKVATGSAPRYGAMSMADLCAIDVEPAANAHLYLWTTNGFLVEAHELARAWGFRPKTMITWGKMKSDGTPSMKTGYYYRGATEHCLFCVRGTKLRLRGPAAPTLHLSPRLPHSVKPEWFYALVEQQSPGPYLELFARRTRLGWTTRGDQVPEPICRTQAA